MGIAKEDLEAGARCFHVEKQGGPGGVAVQQKLVSVKVLKVDKTFALVETEQGKRRYVPFSQLQRDDGWVREREKRESEKRARIAREAKPPEPLKFTLADKLMTPETTSNKGATESDREEARRAIEELRVQSTSPPPSAPAPKPVDRSKRLTAAEKNKALDTYLEALEAGMTLDEAIELCGVNETTVRRYQEMRKRGIPLKDSILGRIPGSKTRSAEERRRIAIAALTEYPDNMRASIGLCVEVSNIHKYIKQLREGLLGEVPPEAKQPRLAAGAGHRKTIAAWEAAQKQAEAAQKQAEAAPVAAETPSPPAVRLVPPPAAVEPPAPPPAPPPEPPPEPGARILEARVSELEGELEALRGARVEATALRAELERVLAEKPDAPEALARELKDMKAENERLRARIAKLLTLIAED